jgi:hypothetical protein
LEIERIKRPVIEVNVVVQTLMVEHMDEMQRYYEKNYDPFLLHQIHFHPLFSIVGSEIESNMIKKG